MKTRIFFCLAFFALLFSCKDVDSISPPVVLQVDVNLDMLEARSVISEFINGDEIGLGVMNQYGDDYNDCNCNSNIRTIYKEGWEMDYRVELSEQTANVYGYYPYSSMVKDISNIPVQVSNQVDYLYAKPVYVNQSNPLARLQMKHAFSLISFIVRNEGYTGTGRISNIEMNGVGSTGILNAFSGEVIVNEIGTELFPCDLFMEIDSPLKMGIIAFPFLVNTDTSPVIVKFTIDGNVYYYQVADCLWESGKEYIYSLKINEADEVLMDVDDIVVENWGNGGNYNGALVGEHYLVDIIHKKE